MLSVGDAVSKQGLVKYHVPVSSLKPFHQYHMEMVMVRPQVPAAHDCTILCQLSAEKLPTRVLAIVVSFRCQLPAANLPFRVLAFIVSYHRKDTLPCVSSRCQLSAAS